jgi:hypothetical protein
VRLAGSASPGVTIRKIYCWWMTALLKSKCTRDLPPTRLSLARTVPTTLEGLAAYLDFVVAHCGEATEVPVFEKEFRGVAEFDLFMESIAQSARQLVRFEPAISSPTMASSVDAPPDLIFAAIEHHRSATEAYLKAVHERSVFEEALDANLRRSYIHAHEREIFETDDPRWLEAIRRQHDTCNAMAGASFALLDGEPATVAGSVAVLEYIVDHMDRYDGQPMGFPACSISKADVAVWHDTRSCEYFVMRNVATALVRFKA